MLPMTTNSKRIAYLLNYRFSKMDGYFGVIKLLNHCIMYLVKKESEFTHKHLEMQKSTLKSLLSKHSRLRRIGLRKSSIFLFVSSHRYYDGPHGPSCSPTQFSCSERIYYFKCRTRNSLLRMSQNVQKKRKIKAE